MRAVDQESHETSAPPAALHFRPGLGWRRRKQVHLKNETRIAMYRLIFTDTPKLGAAGFMSVHENGTWRREEPFPLYQITKIPQTALRPVLVRK